MVPVMELLTDFSSRRSLGQPLIDELLASIGWRRVEVQYSTPIDDRARVRLQRNTKQAPMNAAYHDANHNPNSVAKN